MQPTPPNRTSQLIEQLEDHLAEIAWAMGSVATIGRAEAARCIEVSQRMLRRDVEFTCLVVPELAHDAFDVLQMAEILIEEF